MFEMLYIAVGEFLRVSGESRPKLVSCHGFHSEKLFAVRSIFLFFYLYDACHKALSVGVRSMNQNQGFH